MLSDPFVSRAHSHDAESHARLLGLCAILALPPVQCRDGRARRRRVEVLVEDIHLGDGWEEVDGVVVTPDGILVFRGVNGTRHEWRFAVAPRWRVDYGRERVAVVAEGG